MQAGRMQAGRMQARGRGRGGGRMMSQQQQRKRIPNKLDVFNRFIMFKIAMCLDRGDVENLGSVYPQFTPQPLTPEQQKMRAMKKMQEQKIEVQNPYGMESSGDADPYPQGKVLKMDPSDSTEKNEELSADSGEEKDADKTESSEKKDAAQSDATIDDEKKDDSKGDETVKDNENEAEMTPEKKKELLKKREEAVRLNMTDCHTLLAQLNTKRLYRRIKYFQRKDPDYDVDKAYPYNNDTVGISNIEWEALIEEYKARRIVMLEKMAIEDSEKKANQPKRSRNKKKKKKRGKRKGKKSNNSKSKREETAVEEETKAEEETPEDDTSVANESDIGVDEEGDSDKDGADDSNTNDDDDEYDDELLDFEYVGDKPCKYELLMFTPCPRAVAVLASYPRSGNSLMRNLYEKVTLRVTGSDMMGGLQKHDLVGEMATGTNNVQFVKTHYPERMGHPPFHVNRAVLLVRNPYDAMDSYFNLMSTSSHTTSLSAENRKKYAKIFADMAKKEILVWRDFHEYWLKQKIPLLVVRYEDLIRNTVAVVNKVIKFVLEINSMTFFEDRIQRAIGEEEVEKLGPYKARSGGIGKSLTKGIYTPQLLNSINHGIVGTMAKFGYREMLVPNPSEWKLTPLDQWGVYIPGTSKEPMIINQKGLVRGPNRQTNWRQVKMMVENDKRQSESGKEATAETVDLNWGVQRHKLIAGG